MRTAYVTGSNGFLGLNLVEALLEQGWRVLALHRPSSDVRYLQRFAAERVEGDVGDRASLAHTLPRKLPGVPPDIAAAERGRRGENYLLGGALAAFTGRRPALTPETVALVSRRLQCDCSKAMRSLGYRPVPLRTMVEESCGWLQQEGFLG